MAGRNLEVRSTTREEMIDVTDSVRSAIRAAGVKSGLVCVFSPHTTAGLTVQENADPDVKTDLLGHLGKLVPLVSGWRHGEGNSDAHIKTSLVGNSVTLIVEDGELLLGHWQAVFFCEFDGPRQRRLNVQVVGS